jgi:hypothetical protein
VSRDCDSVQLQRLRFSFRYVRDGNATPARLGTYAAEKRLTITDFGAHSAKWVSVFSKAYRQALRDIQPLT